MLYWLLAANVSLMTLGQIFFKKSSIFIDSHQDLSLITRYLYNHFFLLGIASFGVATIIWVKILGISKISTVYPMQSFAYIFVAIASYYLFQEKLSLVNLIGIVIIIFGVFLIAQGK